MIELSKKEQKKKIQTDERKKSHSFTALKSLLTRCQNGKLKYSANFQIKILHREKKMMIMMMMMTGERRLALFPAGIIARDPHYRESLTRREQDLNLRRT